MSTGFMHVCVPLQHVVGIENGKGGRILKVVEKNNTLWYNL